MAMIFCLASAPHMRTSVMLLAGWLCLPAHSGAADQETAWQAADDGRTLVDSRLHLTWARCVEGMNWDGKTCTGHAEQLTLAQAQARAAQRAKQDGLPWRLPRVTELKRLLDGRTGTEGVDARLFPQAPGTLHWTGTANVRSPGPFNPYRYDNVMRGSTSDDRAHLAFLHGWAVDMSTGLAYAEVAKRTKLAVRLVRASSGQLNAPAPAPMHAAGP